MVLCYCQGAGGGGEEVDGEAGGEVLVCALHLGRALFGEKGGREGSGVLLLTLPRIWTVSPKFARGGSGEEEEDGEEEELEVEEEEVEELEEDEEEDEFVEVEVVEVVEVCASADEAYCSTTSNSSVYIISRLESKDLLKRY